MRLVCRAPSPAGALRDYVACGTLPEQGDGGRSRPWERPTLVRR